ncbi:MAG: glycosyltransferase family 2 protein [bacterium]|nr:glycosyltransferase family 2 protein [bacterium]
MTTSERKKVAVLIPCLNEERSIGSVLRHFPKNKLTMYGYDLEIIVIDNNSSDKTARIASSHGVTVIHEPTKGKGSAIRRGFSHISRDTDYVVMLDGDATYRPEEILRLLELLDSGFCNVVTGSRLTGRISEGSMTLLNRAGNWIFSHLVRQIYQVNVTDVLTGYFAWTRDVVEKLRPHLVSEGFAIEMEMITKMARLGEEIYSVPISYDPRRASASNLHPFYDGSRILFMLFKNMFWRPIPKRPYGRALIEPVQEKSG